MKMSYKRVLTIQDISCVGQCSLTVALPIISACGVETCVLPSAVLSPKESKVMQADLRSVAGAVEKNSILTTFPVIHAKRLPNSWV